jgi:hypothetical protein
MADRYVIAKDTDDGVIAWDGHFDRDDSREAKRFDSPPVNDLARVRFFYSDRSWFIGRVK